MRVVVDAGIIAAVAFVLATAVVVGWWLVVELAFSRCRAFVAWLTVGTAMLFATPVQKALIAAVAALN